MKLNKTLLVIAFAAISQSAFAAKMILYNNTGRRIRVEVRTTKEPKVMLVGPRSDALRGNQYEIRLENGQQLPFDSGTLNSFAKILWKDGVNAGVTYVCDIPSTTVMQKGIISLYKDGQFGINFNRFGAFKAELKQAERSMDR
jgi:hypothetical protein